MSLPLQLPHKRHTGDGSQVSYAYDFELLDSQELAVYVDDLLTTAYNLTGLGVVSGGLVVFYSPPGLGVEIVFLRLTATTQPLTLHVGGVLPTAALERQDDRMVMMVQDLQEILQRIPQLAPTVRDVLRSLAFPQPAAGAPLIGWNASLTALTLYPLGIDVQVISPAVGHVYGRVVVTLTASAGAAELRASAALPANARVLGVPITITTAFGTSQGLSGLLCGDDLVIDRWSSVPIALTLGTVTGEGNFSSDSERQVDSAADLVIRADGGAFDATGALTAVIHYRQLAVA